MDDYIEEEMQIMKEQNGEPATFSSEIFKQPIKDLKKPKVITLDISTTIGEAIAVMQKNRFGSVLITENGKLAGIVTERDILLKVIGIIDDFQNTKITQVMTPDPIALLESDMIAYVMHNMHVGGYRHVPIVNEDNEPINIISIKDVTSFILDHFPEEITNITGEPYRGPAKREGA